MKEFAKPQDDILKSVLKLNQKEMQSKKSREIEGTKMPGVDYRNTSLHYNRGIPLHKQMPRSNVKSDHLPSHMQNNAGRTAIV